MNIGDVIIYGRHGICKVTGLQDMCVDETMRPYYVLRPVYNTGATIYVSAVSDSKKTEIRKLLSTDEIFSLVKKLSGKNFIWNKDNRKRKELYSQILADGNHTELINMIKTLQCHKKDLKDVNKNNKLQISDEDFLKGAEKTLCEEFAYVLKINREEVMPFIYGHSF